MLYCFICIAIHPDFLIADSDIKYTRVHKSKYTKIDIFHKYTQRNNRWVAVEWAWRNGHERVRQ